LKKKEISYRDRLLDENKNHDNKNDTADDMKFALEILFQDMMDKMLPKPNWDDTDFLL
jgi:hypothetical protein